MQFYQFLSKFQPRSRRGEWRCIEPINFPQIKINFIDPIKPIENVRTAIDRKRDVHSWTFPGTNTDCVDKALLQKHHQLCVVWMHFSGSLYFWHSRPCIVHVEFDKQPKHGAAPWYMSSRTKSDLGFEGLVQHQEEPIFPIPLDRAVCQARTARWRDSLVSQLSIRSFENTTCHKTTLWARTTYFLF